MEAVWIDRAWRDTVWALLHNIKLRMDRTVASPRAAVSGFGAGAVLHLDLPQSGGADGADYGIVPVRNVSGALLPKGTPVVLTGTCPEDRHCFDAERAVNTVRPWGILLDELEVRAEGSALFSGCVRVPVAGKAKRFAQPGADSMIFADRGNEVLHYSDGVALLRVTAFQSADRGPFDITLTESGKLAVTAGYLNRNGEFLTVPAAELNVKSGVLCVHSTIKGGVWTAPEIRFAEPAADAFPIGRIDMDGTRPLITRYPVTVAIILMTKRCPLAKDFANG